MPKPVPKNIRLLIIKNREEGKSIKEIAKIFDITTRTVLNILRHTRERGTVSLMKAKDRARITTADEDSEIQRSSERDPYKSASRIKAELSLNASAETV